jgi:hypothetical protein
VSASAGGGFYVTEAGEAALAAAEQRGDGRHVYTGDSRNYFLTEEAEAALAATDLRDLTQPLTAADRSLARLEEAFPQFTIWFAKISHTTVVWTARLKVGEGSVQEYSPSALHDRLATLAARMPKSA